MTIGDRIKQKRIDLGLSQDDLAKKVGYKSRSSIQKIETARNLPIKKIELMAIALDCSPGYLMGWDEETESNYNNVVNGIAYGERLKQYTPEEITRALDFLDAVKLLSPDRQRLVEDLLKSYRS